MNSISENLRTFSFTNLEESVKSDLVNDYYLLESSYANFAIC